MGDMTQMQRLSDRIRLARQRRWLEGAILLLAVFTFMAFMVGYTMGLWSDVKPGVSQSKPPSLKESPGE